MKTLLKIVVALVVVLLIVVGVVLMKIDSIAKAAVEKGGTYALGVETTVDSIDISLFGGKLAMDGLTAGNPDGYPAPHLLRSGHFGISVTPGSIRTDTVEIPEIVIDGLDVHIEKNKETGKYNVQVVTDHLKSLSKDKPEEPKEDEKPGKQFMVKRLEVRNITATVDLPTGVTTPIKPPDIVLENVTKDNVPIGELIAQMFPAIMMGVLQSHAAELEGLAEQLGTDLVGAAEALGGNAAALANQASEQAIKALEEGKKVVEGAAEDVGETVKGVADEADKTIKDAAKGIGDGLGGLLGGEKKKE